MKRVCVYCGSKHGTNPAYRAAAAELGTLLARRGIGIVYGGGNIGLMGTLADAALAAGGQVTGVFPELFDRKVLHAGLSETLIVRTMHERKAEMERLADGFIALPGGWGTLEEVCEAVTWAQLEIHAKPCGLLNVAGYFDAFLTFLGHAVAEGFIYAPHRARLHAATDPAALLALMGRPGRPAP